MNQLPLRLAARRQPTLQDFVGEQTTVQRLATFAEGDGTRALIVVGAAGHGKSHLASAVTALAREGQRRVAFLPLADLGPRAAAAIAAQAAEAADLVVIDDLDAVAGDPAAEQSLFALVNRQRDGQGQWFGASARLPTSLPWTLADLRSRFEGAEVLALPRLRDSDRRELWSCVANRRGFDLPETLVAYLLQRGPRDPREIAAVVSRLDEMSLADRRCMTIALAREALAAAAEPPAAA